MSVDPSLERLVRVELVRHDHGARRPAARRARAWALAAPLVARDLSAAGLTEPEIQAVQMLADTDPLTDRAADIERVRVLADAGGSAGRIARVVARAALTD